MPHLFDDRTQLHYTVWHNDPTLEKVVRNLIETTRPNRWVETGTHMGWTSMWIAKNYPDLPIYTVETDPGFYAKAKENLAEYPQVALSYGHSADFLRRLEPVLRRGLSIFWLDAHWWPPVPLRDECRVVASLDRYVCLIDDFSCWNPDFSGDTFFTIAPNFGDAYLNDIAYVSSVMKDERYWRPNYEGKPGFKGYGLFTKGVDYRPPFMKHETLDSFITSRPKSVAERPDDPSFAVYPLHPSCRRSA